jgi:hypothetical protein
MIAYKKANGLCTEARFVTDDHVPLEGEFVMQGDLLPTLDSLSDPAAVALRDASKPDVPGFVDSLKAAMGGIVGSNGLAKAYPLFYPALSNGAFADVQALVIDGLTTGVLSQPQYAAIKQLAVQHNIPITLP